MKINLRQEIALWVLGLLWTGIAVLVLSKGTDLAGLWQAWFVLVVLLVPVGLIIISLRDRQRASEQEGKQARAARG